MKTKLKIELDLTKEEAKALRNAIDDYIQVYHAEHVYSMVDKVLKCLDEHGITEEEIA